MGKSEVRTIKTPKAGRTCHGRRKFAAASAKKGMRRSWQTAHGEIKGSRTLHDSPPTRPTPKPPCPSAPGPGASSKGQVASAPFQTPETADFALVQNRSAPVPNHPLPRRWPPHPSRIPSKAEPHVKGESDEGSDGRRRISAPASEQRLAKKTWLVATPLGRPVLHPMAIRGSAGPACTDGG